MDDRNQRRREAFIATEVARAAEAADRMRSQGKTVCDVALIEGAMADAAKLFDRLNSKT